MRDPSPIHFIEFTHDFTRSLPKITRDNPRLPQTLLSGSPVESLHWAFLPFPAGIRRRSSYQGPNIQGCTPLCKPQAHMMSWSWWGRHCSSPPPRQVRRRRRPPSIYSIWLTPRFSLFICTISKLPRLLGGAAEPEAGRTRPNPSAMAPPRQGFALAALLMGLYALMIAPCDAACKPTATAAMGSAITRRRLSAALPSPDASQVSYPLAPEVIENPMVTDIPLDEPPVVSSRR